MQSDDHDLHREEAGVETSNLQEPSSENISSGSTNVRSRVRYWFNDIVDEMRKKSPASVQKWVDSIQIPSGGADGAQEAGPSSTELAEQQQRMHHACLIESAEPTESAESGSEMDHESNEDAIRLGVPMSHSDGEQNPTGGASAGVDQKSEGSSMSIKNLLSKKTLLEKFSRSSTNLEQAAEQEIGLQEDDTRKTSSLASIGKIKINEFYDKLNMNKAKYNLIKARNIDIRNMIGASKDSINQKLQQPQQPPNNFELPPKLIVAVEAKDEPMVEPIVVENEGGTNPERSETSGKLSTADIYEFSFDESFPKDDDVPDPSEDDEKENFEVSPQLYDIYLNPPKTYQRMGIGKIGRSSSENPRISRRFNLMEIGRSFSEMNDDDNFIIGEGNNSCPNPSSLNTSSSINNSSTNILARSVPVSPIPRTSSKLSIHQENSLSDSPRRRSTMLMKDSSLQSDSSRCSSVESLLNARKPDPERILLNLGFGPAPHSTDVLSKIPKRFLKPSQVRGVDTEAFLRQQQLSMHIHENSVLGYRGLVGNPHIPPSMIVAKIMERFQENERGRLERSSTISGAIEMSTSVPMAAQCDSQTSSSTSTHILIPRHSSLASEGRLCSEI
ncbi:uncharacterized protein LOC129764887 isoform X2 [Toxorhynchites rutilus septentrionalis]|uniref:uncharacterized protein LOC129764887 isoform X2 n=1 Tax=Toxorhynchites rutilus septentrionalis TaxID=329112 RepID=UPI0024796576|nr:uncharacterized protein LOC129764887 isoform X2 [Toxorhynchites rutilus septentrionalis]